jgi:chemotaxis protein histidine kinase CheA
VTATGIHPAASASVDDELRELQRDYLEDVREKIALMKHHCAALREKKQFKISFPVLLFLSHQLKGSGGSLGFPEVSSIAREMSQLLNDYLEAEEKRQSPADLAQAFSVLTTRLEESARLP